MVVFSSSVVVFSIIYTHTVLVNGVDLPSCKSVKSKISVQAKYRLLAILFWSAGTSVVSCSVFLINSFPMKRCNFINECHTSMQTQCVRRKPEEINKIIEICVGLSIQMSMHEGSTQIAAFILMFIFNLFLNCQML